MGHSASRVEADAVGGFLEAVARGDNRRVRRYLRRARELADATDHDGNSALFWACHEGHRDTARILLRAGAAPQVEPHRENGNPLRIASQEGRPDIVRLLLRYGAEPDRGNREQPTPLQIAAQEGHAEVVGLLLQYGAGPGIANGARTPLQLAEAEGNSDIVALLLGSGR